MRTYIECVPCFIKQALIVARFISDDEQVHEKILRKTMAVSSKMDFNVTPPEIGRVIHRVIREISKNPDPYRQIKAHSNQLALKLYPEMKKEIAQSNDPLGVATRIAISGNIIDFAQLSSLDDAMIKRVIKDSVTAPLSKSNIDDFRLAVNQARNVLYLGDNAGEIVFDRLLLEQLPREKITFAVRGSPVINDATMDDAKQTGITEIVRVIDNGSDVPGTILKTCSDAFRSQFEKSDLIVSKGQGNYETLSDENKDIIFLFKVKCPVVARDVGGNVGDLILKKNIYSF